MIPALAICMVYLLFKSIISVVNRFALESKTVKGIVCELKFKNVNYEESGKKIVSVEYVYSVSVADGEDTCIVDYTERIPGDKPSKIALGSSLSVVVDFDRKVAIKAKTMEDCIWKWPVGFLVCAAILAILIYLS